jgi:hypothetical protein
MYRPGNIAGYLFVVTLQANCCYSYKTAIIARSVHTLTENGTTQKNVNIHPRLELDSNLLSWNVAMEWVATPSYFLGSHPGPETGCSDCAFRGFLCPSRTLPGWYLKPDHDSFISHSSQFIIH